MTQQCILHTPIPANPHQTQLVSTFMPPVPILIGEEGSQNLEDIVKAKTGETVKADENWSRLSGIRSINTSVVGGFMFQSDAGSNCSVHVTENGNLPVQILIDRDHDFGMFLVVTQRHEQWTTFGKFYLRFLRRVPVSDKKCTDRMEGPFAGPSPSVTGSDKDSTKEPGSLMHRPASAVDESEEQKIADRVAGASASLPAPTTSSVLFKNAYYIPLARKTGISESGESTDEEDHAEIGAAALKGTGGGIIPPGMFAPPE